MRELTEAEVALVSGRKTSVETQVTIGLIGLFCPIAGPGMTVGYYVNRD